MRRLDAVARFARATGVVACLSTASIARAQTLAVSGNPGTLSVQSATSGLAPIPVSNSTTTYTLGAVPKSGVKMTAQLSAAMPAGLTLTINVAPPTTGASVGNVTLDVAARDVLTGVTQFKGTETRTITYTLTATAAAGIVPLQSRTVTLTITSAP